MINTFIKKVIHESTRPFTDFGPFGAGPMMTKDNPRTLTTAINKIHKSTWTPPRELSGELALEMGRRFPILAATPENPVGKGFGEWIIRAVHRAKECRDIDQAVLHAFGLNGHDYDRDAFLDYLRDPILLEVFDDRHAAIGVAQGLSTINLADRQMPREDWELLAQGKNGFGLIKRSPEAFAEKMEGLRSKVNTAADPDFQP